jgi:hypothetical protein
MWFVLEKRSGFKIPILLQSEKGNYFAPEHRCSHFLNQKNNIYGYKILEKYTTIYTHTVRKPQVSLKRALYFGLHKKESQIK